MVNFNLIKLFPSAETGGIFVPFSTSNLSRTKLTVFSKYFTGAVILTNHFNSDSMLPRAKMLLNFRSIPPLTAIFPHPCHNVSVHRFFFSQTVPETVVVTIMIAPPLLLNRFHPLLGLAYVYNYKFKLLFHP